MSNQYKMSTTVAKAFAVLDILVSKGEAGLSLAEVSRELGVSKSTAHRYLTTLKEMKIVRRDGRDRFALGPKLIELAGAFLSQDDLRKQSVPFLEQLSALTQETSHLAIPSGSSVIYMAKIDSPHSIRMASHIGARMPMHSTSLGKSILAHYSREQLEEIIGEGLPMRTPSTITTRQDLEAELEHVRAQGFAVDDQENEMGVRCVGAPIFDYTGKVIGAISISGPANRLDRELSLEHGPVVRDSALQLSKLMGYLP